MTTDDIDLSDPQYYLNRELSALAFQRRVLHEATDERNPPLERLKFLAFFTKNVDEFFMKRVGGLKQQIDAGITEPTADGRTPKEQHAEILDVVRPMFDAQTECYREEIEPALADAGIEIRSYDDLDADERAAVREYFEDSVLPTLTPLSFDPARPFPFISNLSLSLAVLSRKPGEETPTFTRIKIPPNRPRFVEVGPETYVLVEEVIEANLDILLPNVEIVDVSKFRLTRNAEVRRDEEVAEDLIAVMEDVLEQRRFATTVRLEVAADTPQRTISLLTDQLDLDEDEVFYRKGPIDYEDFFDLVSLDRPALKAPDWTPRPHPRFVIEPTTHGLTTDSTSNIFEAIRQDDVLLHHPYHSFDTTVQRFLDEAANDPDVLAIKAAIYRTASDSKVIETLIDAAENGKQVAVMVELKARFDEKNNLQWVRELEEHGIHVAYGTIGLKTHTKTALVVREEKGSVQLYSHVATGNYHSETAKSYVDLGLLTADRAIGQDLVKLFNFFTGPSIDDSFRKLLIAPVTMRARFVELIRREARHAEAGRHARIVVKANSLEDPEIVRELYRASQAGVDIDLLVRDICRLRPGLEGISENVSVYSVVGRFLEHSRIFYFENGARSDPSRRDGEAGEAGDASEASETGDPGDRGDDDSTGPEYYIGSADWMSRNLDNRVEAITPIKDPAICAQLRFVLETMLVDNRTRWVMHADGTYTQLRPGPDEEPRGTQQVLMRHASTSESGPGERDLGIAIDRSPEVIDDEDRGALVLAPSDEARTARAADGGSDGVTQVRTMTDASVNPVTDGVDTTGESQSRDADAAVDADPDPSTDADTSANLTPDDGDRPAAFGRFDEHWYVPDSDTYAYAVRTPDGDRRYYETAAGAARSLEAFYGEA